MILIDLAIFALFALFTITGYHKGFIKALLNIATFFISMFGAWGLHSQLAHTIMTSGKVMPVIINYSESSDMLGSVENVRAVATKLSPSALNEILLKANLPHPLTALLSQNVADAAFAPNGLITLGDYLAMTIASMTINIISYISVFIIFYVIFNVLINLYDYVFKLPVLKLFDNISGALLGFLQGFLVMFLVFSMVPVILAFLPFKEILGLIQQSQMGNFYYLSNFIIDMIKGTIT